MGKKGKKTRWRRLPIGGADEEGGLSLDSAPPTTDNRRITFNEDEYTKITTPRQDVLFKKGYFGRKRTNNFLPSPSEAQEVHSGDSVESESYQGEEMGYAYPAGYMDPNGVFYVNGSAYETYDPYTGTVTVVVGPPPQYPGGPPVLAALPYQPVPLQPVEWFNPPTPWCYNKSKRYSSDSQNCSAQSSESTGPPGSPQEPTDEGACAMYSPQYVYPGFMFGPPIYNMNGVTVQGVVPQPVPLTPDMASSKRRKKRRRRKRGGVTEDGSESSCCEDPLVCDVAECQSESSCDVVCQSGASSDVGAGTGSVSSKANSDSGINTDPTPNSGSNSPPPPTLAQVTIITKNVQLECHEQIVQDQFSTYTPSQSQPEEKHTELLENSEEVTFCAIEETTNNKDNDKNQCPVETISPDDVSEGLSATEDDSTPNLRVATPEFSSQESTLSCLSTPSVSKDLSPSEQELLIVDTPQEKTFEDISITETDVSSEEKHLCGEDLQISEQNCDSLSTLAEDPTDNRECFTETNNITDVNVEEELLNNSNDSLQESITNEIEPQDETTKHTEPSDLTIVENCKTELTDSTISDISKEEIDHICNGNTDFVSTSSIHVTMTTSVEAVPNIDSTIPIIEEHSNSHFIESENIQIPLNIISSVSGSTETISNTNSSASVEVLSSIIEIGQECLESMDTLAPVPPPRRKRSMCRAAEKLAAAVVEEVIKAGVKEAATRVRLKGTLTITEAVTQWLNSQANSPLTCPASDSECEDDEGIEVSEELTGQKNVQGNPFLASSHSDAGQRVAKDCDSMDSSAGEWDMWDHSHTRDMCDPARSVDKYYRLAAVDGIGDKVPPSVYKTAMHIRHAGPFPCGVCCIIQ